MFAIQGGRMKADRVELTWDSQKSNWLVRIEAGEEVVRRHLALPRETPEPTLRAAAQKISEDEGYDATNFSIAHAATV
jgi:hypothetical protein